MTARIPVKVAGNPLLLKGLATAAPTDVPRGTHSRNRLALLPTVADAPPKAAVSTAASAQTHSRLPRDERRSPTAPAARAADALHSAARCLPDTPDTQGPAAIASRAIVRDRGRLNFVRGANWPRVSRWLHAFFRCKRA